AGTIYGYGASVYIPSGQVATPSTRMTVQFYSSTDCSTGYISNIFTNYDTPPFDTWTIEGGSGPAPPTSMSAALLLWIGSTGGTVQMNYDNAYLGVGLTPVELTDFTVE